MKSIVVILSFAIFFRFEEPRSQEKKILPDTFSSYNHTQNISSNINEKDKGLNNLIKYYHVDFIQIWNNEYYNLKVKIFNLNCCPVLYEIILVNSKDEKIIEEGSVDEMSGKEHTYEGNYLSSQGAAYIIIRYNKMYKNKFLNNKTVQNKQMQIQTEYTYKNYRPIINNVPGTLLFKCYNQK